MWFEYPPVDTILIECVPEWALVVSIVAEPPLWAVAITLPTLVSTVPSKSAPMTPVDGVEPVGGVAVVAVVAGGVLVVAGTLVVVAVPCKH